MHVYVHKWGGGAAACLAPPDRNLTLLSSDYISLLSHDVEAMVVGPQLVVLP